MIERLRTQLLCGRHSERGDASLEDCDKNYELVKGDGKAARIPDDESPSAFGGVASI